MPSTILLVDTDTESRLKTTQLLLRAGHGVRAVSSFEQAKQALRDSVPDLLITDSRLGAFNGLQLILRRIDHPAMAAILRHSVKDPVLEAEARHLGAAYTVKTSTGVDLLEIVNKLLPANGRDAEARRWIRKRIDGGLPATIEELSVHVIDMSYGGLRLRLREEPRNSLPTSFEVGLTSGVSVKARQVWSARDAASGHWLCGAEVKEIDADRNGRWRVFVDSVA